MGILVAVAAIIAAVQIVGGSAGPLILPLAQTLVAKANTAKTPADARRLVERALALQPANAALWVTLARIDAQDPGGIGATSFAMLDRSYLVGPYDPRVLADRVSFAFDHWDALPADLKVQVQHEVDTAWSVQDQRQRLNNVLGSLTDPRGRLVYWTELFNLHLADISAWVAQHGPATPQPSAAPAL